jgi:hypothetical protein
MASKYFLVYRGRIRYYPRRKLIQCLGFDACFRIKLTKNTKVTTRGSYASRDSEGNIFSYYGEELLSNGKRFWVRLVGEDK